MFCEHDCKQRRDWEEQLGFHTRLLLQVEVSRPMHARCSGIRFRSLRMLSVEDPSILESER